MPIYDYACGRCAARTEFIHGIDAPAPRFCPACGAEDTLRKVFVPPSIHFKGSGWAKKDRSSGASRKASTGDGDGKPAGEKAAAGSAGAEAAPGDGATPKAGSGGPSSGSTGSKPAATSTGDS